MCVALFRLFRGKPIFEADKSHIHHLVMAVGFSMHQALASIMGLFLFFCGLNAALYVWGVSDTWIVVLDVLSYGLFHVAMYLCSKCRA